MNRNTIGFLVSMTVGAAIGAFLTYRETKNTITELVAEADDIFDRLDKYVQYVEREKIDAIKQEIKQDEDFIAEYWTPDDNKKDERDLAVRTPSEKSGIVRISEEDMFEDPMYERVSLVYYAQNGGVYECVGNYRLEDPYSAIGDDFEEIFKNEEDTDVLFIRNHDQCVDYEVLLDYKDPPEEE